MKFEDIKKGQKVVPHSKSTWCSLEDDRLWKKAKEIGQNFLYVSEINKEDENLTLSLYPEEEEGSLYLPGDVDLYNENKDQNFKDEIKLGYFEISYDPNNDEIVIYNHVTGKFEYCNNFKGVLSHVKRELEEVHEDLPEYVNLY